MARRRKQTKDDFPSDLLYSQGRVWVRRGRDGTARLGLNVPAISERVPNLYYVDIRPRGYLVQGTDFGAVDLDTARLRLTAPFSARIARVNWDAVSDPLLLMTEPFEGGWLYELTKIKDVSWSNLLDRDAFWSYLEFERLARRLGIPPVLSAEYRLDRDVPVWPDDVRVTFGGLTVLTGNVVRLGRNQTFTPQWGPGDRWRVEVEFEQPSIAMVPEDLTGPKLVKRTWAYEVVDTNGNIRGQTCYVVKAIEVEGSPPQTHFLLSFLTDDFSLCQVEEVSVFDSTRRTLTVNDWGRDSFLELREPREILLDLPLFPAENRDEERVVQVGSEPELQQRATFPDARTMEIECRGQYGSQELLSRQVWERGLLWWREAERRVGDTVLMKGRLLTEGR